jgi:simple sugar transport system permease protein
MLFPSIVRLKNNFSISALVNVLDLLFFNKLNNSKKKFDVGSWLIPVIAVFIALFIGGILIKLQGLDPVVAYRSLFKTAFGSVEGIGATLGKSTPLVLAGLAVAVGLRAGLFNIGAQGQLLSGSLAAAWAGVTFDGLPGFIHIPVALIIGAFFGSLVAAISGLLKAYRGVHEVITTIMLNSIVMAIADYLASGRLREPDQFLTRTSEIAENAKLPIFGSLPSGFFIAVILGVFIWWVLGRTTSGFRIETVGRNRHAAWYSGISVKRTVVSAMVISGAIAGLGGAIETLGVTYRYAPAFNLGLGFDGITIALLGRVHPIGIIPGAILIGGMRAGAANMQFDAGVAPELVDLLMALILLFVTAPLITRFFKNSRNKSVTSGWGN